MEYLNKWKEGILITGTIVRRLWGIGFGQNDEALRVSYLQSPFAHGPLKGIGIQAVTVV